MSLVSAAAFTTACGGDDGTDEFPITDCSDDERAQMIAVGLENTGEAGMAVRLIEADPATPLKGDNDWQVQIFDAAGAPLDGAGLEIFPFMPDHGHGTTVPVGIQPIMDTSGGYTLSPLNLWMPGIWTITVRVKEDPMATMFDDEVEFAVCIEG